MDTNCFLFSRLSDYTIHFFFFFKSWYFFFYNRFFSPRLFIALSRVVKKNEIHILLYHTIQFQKGQSQYVFKIDSLNSSIVDKISKTQLLGKNFSILAPTRINVLPVTMIFRKLKLKCIVNYKVLTLYVFNNSRIHISLKKKITLLFRLIYTID